MRRSSNNIKHAVIKYSTIAQMSSTMHVIKGLVIRFDDTNTIKKFVDPKKMAGKNIEGTSINL